MSAARHTPHRKHREPRVQSTVPQHIAEEVPHVTPAWHHVSWILGWQRLARMRRRVGHGASKVENVSQSMPAARVGDCPGAATIEVLANGMDTVKPLPDTASAAAAAAAVIEPTVSPWQHGRSQSPVKSIDSAGAAGLRMDPENHTATIAAAGGQSNSPQEEGLEEPLKSPFTAFAATPEDAERGQTHESAGPSPGQGTKDGGWLGAARRSAAREAHAIKKQARGWLASLGPFAMQYGCDCEKEACVSGGTPPGRRQSPSDAPTFNIEVLHCPSSPC